MSVTNQERILAAAKGGMVDRLPYVPRIDLWYNANKRAGTLPPEHANRTIAEICKAEGWGSHHLVPAFLRRGQQPHRALGLYNLPEQPYRVELGSDVSVETIEEGDFITTIYHTSKGTVRTKTMYTEEMRSSGASITWVAEHVIKESKDYEVVAHIFENLVLTPNYEEFSHWLDEEVGPNGIGAAFASLASSPVHHIQKDFLDATDFYYHYNDYPKPMARLAEGLSVFYEGIFQLILKSPAKAILWGANFDDMITYPSYFVKEIQPWLRKVGPVFKDNGQICICHCDGENLGLLDILPDSGFQVAEAICPWPMTKVKIEDYYHRWHDRLTIFGGIPSNILLSDLTSEADFESYLDTFFQLAPGDRLIVGIADTTPPAADWNRLRRIGERVLNDGRLPLKGLRTSVSSVTQVDKPIAQAESEAGPFAKLRQMVVDGDEDAAVVEVKNLLSQKFPAQDIMDRGLVAAMDIISPQFKAGTIFIPEVLLSARAMNESVLILEPYLKQDGASNQATIVVGTVFGDLHDIGKNMVSTMLKGAGFNVVDLGINVRDNEFVEAIKKYQPRVVGLSALLTTTMPEMERVVRSIEDAGLRKQVSIMVGGAPINQKFADSIGADGYSRDAGGAVDLARRLSA